MTEERAPYLIQVLELAHPGEYHVIASVHVDTTGTPAAIVAVRGWCWADDWAAYWGGYPAGMSQREADQLVARHGAKLREQVARSVFPMLGWLEYRP